MNGESVESRSRSRSQLNDNHTIFYYLKGGGFFLENVMKLNFVLANAKSIQKENEE